MMTTIELVAMVSFTGDPELLVFPYDVDFELDEDDVLVEVYRTAQTEPVHVEPWRLFNDDGLPVFDPSPARWKLADAGYRPVAGSEWEPTNDGYCRTVEVIA